MGGVCWNDFHRTLQAQVFGVCQKPMADLKAFQYSQSACLEALDDKMYKRTDPVYTDALDVFQAIGRVAVVG